MHVRGRGVLGQFDYLLIIPYNFLHEGKEPPLPERNTAMSNVSVTASPITNNEGEYSWTTTDLIGDIHAYRTNGNGRGLWVKSVNVPFSLGGDMWTQIEGTADFNLNCSPSARRRRVLARCTW